MSFYCLQQAEKTAKEAEADQNANGSEDCRDTEATKEGDVNDEKDGVDEAEKRPIEPPKKKVKLRGYHEDPFIFLKEDDSQLNEILYDTF